MLGLAVAHASRADLFLGIPSQEPPVMAVVIQDTFTEAADTALGSHTPDTGTGWTERTNTAGNGVVTVRAATDDATTTAGNNNNNTTFTAQPGPTNAEYDVEFNIKFEDDQNGQHQSFVIARWTDADNYYAVVFKRRFGDATLLDIEMWKRVAGSNTSLGSVVLDSNAGEWGAAGNNYKFEIKDASKKLFQTTTELISSADNDLTSAGEAGLGYGNVFQAGGDQIGARAGIYDNFTVTEADVAGANRRRPRMMLMGVGA